MRQILFENVQLTEAANISGAPKQRPACHMWWV